MSYFTVEFYSDVLGGDGEFAVFLPKNTKPPYKVLWLLHGAFAENHEAILYSSVCLYAEKRGMAIVAPTSYLGVYTDMVYGEKGYSFVEEVVEKAPKLFTCLSTERKDNFIMGISMGGHGSFKLAMNHPDRFYGACGFSSPVDMVYTMSILEAGRHGGGHELYDAFGSSAAYRDSVGDVVGLAEKHLSEQTPLPRLSLCWGDNEHAGPEDERLKQIFDEIGVKMFTKIGHGGHYYDTWDPMMEESLDYIMEGADK